MLCHQRNRPELEDLLERHTQPGTTGCIGIPSLIFYRFDTPNEPVSYLQEQSLCLIVQGTKRVMYANEVYHYDKNHYLLTLLDIPVSAQILEATPEKPYLGIKYKIDYQKINQLIISHPDIVKDVSPVSADTIEVQAIPDALTDAFVRLIKLLDSPEDIPVLAPLIETEILYLLLKSESGAGIRQQVMMGNKRQKIARAIDWLKLNFDQPFRVDELAEMVNMSASSFHHHFKTFTAMSPLQYQKWLRLHEARRILFTENTDISFTAFKVGYESASQFSREYSRLFGVSPLHDMKKLKLAV